MNMVVSTNFIRTTWTLILLRRRATRADYRSEKIEDIDNSLLRLLQKTQTHRNLENEHDNLTHCGPFY